MVRSEKKYAYSKNTIYRDADGLIYILDQKTGTILTLNDTASVLWREMFDPKTASDLADCLCARYDVSRQKAMVDVKNFLDRYRKHGFLDVW